MKLLSRLWLSALSASRYPVTFGGMTCTANDGGLNTVGVSSKLFSGSYPQELLIEEAAFLLLTFQPKQHNL